MELERFMRRIGLQGEARAVVSDHPIPPQEYRQWRKLFYTDAGSFLEAWRRREDRLAWALCFFTAAAAEAYERYQALGIPEKVYWETFSDIAIWCEDCRQRHGVYGLSQAEWIGKSVKLELFRLGRLQFEPVALREAVTLGGETFPAGTQALAVHIPAGEPLDIARCEQSFQRAAAFFGRDRRVCICESWLLAPGLWELLAPGSRILQFQSLLEVIGTDERNPQAEERIFGTVEADKSRYPERSTLQRRAKAYLLSGGRIGVGTGVRMLAEVGDRGYFSSIRATVTPV